MWLLAFYTVIAVLLCSWRTRQKILALTALSLFIMTYAILADALSSSARQNLLRVSVIDVGQGSSSLVQFPTGETMLIDGGGFQDDSFDVGRFVVAPYLWHCGVRKLDYVVT